MMKIAIKLIDGGTEENAVLNIKDNSFVIKTDAGELIKILYTNVKNYKYTENDELTFNLMKGDDIVIKCKLDEALRGKLDTIVSQPKIQEYEEPKTQEYEETMKVKSNEKLGTAKRYNAVVFLPQGQSDCNITLKSENITMESGSEILIVPYSSIIRLELTDNSDIKICSNNNVNFVIRCEEGEVLYNELKKSKSDTIYQSSSSIIIQDIFGNDILKANRDKGSQKLVIWITIIVASVILFISLGNIGNGPADTIAWDVRQMDNIAGYGTKYVIGDLKSITCTEKENDGQGRYIVRCNIQYYPKRNNGSIATDSKMNETIYAVFMRNSDSSFSRRYTSYITSSFKENACWGRSKSAGVFC